MCFYRRVTLLFALAECRVDRVIPIFLTSTRAPRSKTTSCSSSHLHCARGPRARPANQPAAAEPLLHASIAPDLCFPRAPNPRPLAKVGAAQPRALPLATPGAKNTHANAGAENPLKYGEQWMSFLWPKKRTNGIWAEWYGANWWNLKLPCYVQKI